MDLKRLSAATRIALLCDRNSFCELFSDISGSPSAGGVSNDGVITGRGLISGRPVFVFAQDFSVLTGTIGRRHGMKIAHTIEQANRCGCPVVGICDSGGARIGEGVEALAACGEMLRQNALASGHIPQIAVVAGVCAGAAAYSPALSDFVFMAEPSGYMFITGPQVVKNATGEEVSLHDLGCAALHCDSAGDAHFNGRTEQDCYAGVRALLSYLPSNYREKQTIENPAFTCGSGDAQSAVPVMKSKGYDMRGLIGCVADKNSFFEVSPTFAASMLTGFARICGINVGVVANQPSVNAGTIDCDGSDKAAGFIRLCDSFNLPVVTLVDTPGYMPGITQERQGIIRHGAKILYAYSEARVPKLTVIVRKAYGGAYIAMGSRHIGGDCVYALPDAEIAVMGAESAVGILYKNAAAKMDDAEKKDFLKQKAIEYGKTYMNSDMALREGYLDAVLPANGLRKRLYSDLLAFSAARCNEKPAHGNIPL